MEPFTVHAGQAMPMRMVGVDTDQIIPSVYLKRTSRTGYADACFAGRRGEPDFVLNDPRYRSASVLVAGKDFGIGSAREPAVWALQDYGFRAVVSPRFGDHFRSNALRNGLLAITLPESQVDRLLDVVTEQPAGQVTVDLVARVVRAARFVASFEIDDFTRQQLLAGMDEVELTLRHAGAIGGHEDDRPRWMPRVVRSASGR